MEAIIRDPLWQFVGVVVGLIALSVAVWQALRATHRIAFEYRVDSLATVSQSVASDVRILFKGNPVDHVQLVLVRVINTASQAVRAADFEDRLRIALGPDARVLSADVATRRPAHLDVRLSTEVADAGQVLAVEPMLLNRGDSFTVKAIVSGRVARPSVTARIANVSTIELLARDRESFKARILRALLLPTAYLFLLVFLGARVRAVTTVFGVVALVLLLTVAGALGSQWLDRRMDRDRL